MLDTPFSPWPSYEADEMQAVHDVLASNRVNYWTGDTGKEFEAAFAEWTGSKHAIALANGTLALDLALHGLGIGAGDEVIVTPRSFMASVSSVIVAGATPVFADVDLDTQNLSRDTIAPHVTERTKAVICVHLGGLPCDMDPIMELAAQAGFYVIEDCAQAHGARYKERSVGSIGHVSAWSFCQDKIMTTGGEGGMVTCEDDDLFKRMWSYKDHGKSPRILDPDDKPNGYSEVYPTFGTNWRLSGIQAAIGLVQLQQKMDGWHEKRSANTRAIRDSAADIDVFRVLPLPNWAEHAGYREALFVRPDQLKTGWDRDRVVAEIVASGVPCYPYLPDEIFAAEAFDGTPWRPQKPLPNARQLAETGIAFLVHPTLTDQEIEKTCQAIRAVGKAARA